MYLKKENHYPVISQKERSHYGVYQNPSLSYPFLYLTEKII